MVERFRFASLLAALLTLLGDAIGPLRADVQRQRSALTLALSSPEFQYQ